MMKKKKQKLCINPCMKYCIYIILLFFHVKISFEIFYHDNCHN